MNPSSIPLIVAPSFIPHHPVKTGSVRSLLLWIYFY
ncbi:hypothetical protein [Coxiella burnetii]|uniref:Uncharacterized protein n=1 Tax=Coxiella burnetii (strain RSA 493 / Nine Mile phase I) TaxID=227377 RepID=B5QSC6_COXBU|nr:hypothetical protein [Coxiella burnetii]YP_002332999.1 hypothetical protein CBU_1332a [Coxiella burnetii RSA 493]ACI15290.1 hypothetical protein CBU_1332a [Coxiella burnetii RSA 493]PNT89745.1 hypothetical protein C2L89_02460 [Coxiella burnetii]UYK69096.1 hypothetical protein OHM78_06795 [Coxiella burnetii]BBL39019.1 hypothetical protein CBUVS42_C12790 [Coxiella burnetii]